MSIAVRCEVVTIEGVNIHDICLVESSDEYWIFMVEWDEYKENSIISKNRLESLERIYMGHDFSIAEYVRVTNEIVRYES